MDNSEDWEAILETSRQNLQEYGVETGTPHIVPQRFLGLDELKDERYRDSEGVYFSDSPEIHLNLPQITISSAEISSHHDEKVYQYFNDIAPQETSDPERALMDSLGYDEESVANFLSELLIEDYRMADTEREVVEIFEEINETHSKSGLTPPENPNLMMFDVELALHHSPPDIQETVEYYYQKHLIVTSEHELLHHKQDEYRIPLEVGEAVNVFWSNYRLGLLEANDPDIYISDVKQYSSNIPGIMEHAKALEELLVSGRGGEDDVLEEVLQYQERFQGEGQKRDIRWTVPSGKEILKNFIFLG